MKECRYGRTEGGQGPERALAAVLAAHRIAVLSPSSHNCQPWHLEIRVSRGSVKLRLRQDETRSLHALPAYRKEMLLSLGAYWYALREALRASGWDIVMPPLQEVGPIRTGWVEPGTVGQEEAITNLRLMRARRTDRGQFMRTPLEATEVASLQAAASQASESHVGTTTQVVTGSALSDVSGLLARYGPRDFLSGKAWKETFAFVRSDRAAARARNGFTYKQIFGPGTLRRQLVYSVATHPTLMPLTGRLGLSKSISNALATSMDTGPGALVLSAAPDLTDQEWVAAGAVLHNVWLRATTLGLNLHPVSVLLQHSDTRKQVATIVGCEGEPFFMARIGRSVASNVGPRLRHDPDSSVTVSHLPRY